MEVAGTGIIDLLLGMLMVLLAGASLRASPERYSWRR